MANFILAVLVIAGAVPLAALGWMIWEMRKEYPGPALALAFAACGSAGLGMVVGMNF